MARPSSAASERPAGIHSKLTGHTTAVLNASTWGTADDIAGTSFDGIWRGPTRTRPMSAPAHGAHAQWADHSMKIPTTYMDAASVLSTAHQELYTMPQRKARPKSASVTAAAWKAYGSPKLRGQVRPPSVPAAVHPKAMSLAPDALHSRPPAVGKLGGGFHYPPAGNHTAARRSGHFPYTASSHGDTQLQTIPEFHGRMISDPPVPAAPELLMPFQPRNADTLMSIRAEEGSGDADEYRFSPTHPTDPFAQRTWAGILARHDTRGAHRPQSARPASPTRHQHHSPQAHAPSRITSTTVHGTRPCSARARFTSMSVGAVAHLGPAYAPPAVAGASEPVAEFPLPDPQDTRWSNSRLGASAMQRLTAGLKLPMDAATHTGTSSRPISPMQHATAAQPQQRSPRTHGPAESMLMQQQAELGALLAAEQVHVHQGHAGTLQFGAELRPAGTQEHFQAQHFSTVDPVAGLSGVSESEAALQAPVVLPGEQQDGEPWTQQDEHPAPQSVQQPIDQMPGGLSPPSDDLAAQPTATQHPADGSLPQQSAPEHNESLPPAVQAPPPPLLQGTSMRLQLESTVDAVDAMLMRSASSQREQGGLVSGNGGTVEGVRPASARPMTALRPQRGSGGTGSSLLSTHAVIEEAGSEEDEDMMVD